MKVPAMTLMWIGSIVIFFSIALQAVTLYYPSLILATFALVLSAISIPFTIWQAYKSALEAEQERRKLEVKTQEAFNETPKGRTLGSLSQQHTGIHNQEPHN